MIKSSGDKLLSLTMIRIVGFLFGTFIVLTQPAIDWVLVPYVLTAAAIHFVYFYCLINAYKVGDFTLVYPVSRGVAPLLVLLMGLFILNESLSQGQFIGTILICAGVLALAFSNGRIATKPLLFALGTATCIASYTMVSGVAVRIAGSIWVYIGWLELITGLSVIVFSLLRRKKVMLTYVKFNALQGAVAGILSICAYLAALWAISRVPMAPIAALRETSIIFAAIIGVWFMQESFAKHRVFASVLVVFGVVFLSGSN